VLLDYKWMTPQGERNLLGGHQGAAAGGGVERHLPLGIRLRRPVTPEGERPWELLDASVSMVSYITSGAVMTAVLASRGSAGAGPAMRTGRCTCPDTAASPWHSR
jgi:hypothetical protein